jgi:hypothetical protein
MSLFLYFHVEDSMMMQEWNLSSGFLLEFNIHYQDGMKFKMCISLLVRGRQCIGSLIVHLMGYLCNAQFGEFCNNLRKCNET